LPTIPLLLAQKRGGVHLIYFVDDGTNTVNLLR